MDTAEKGGLARPVCGCQYSPNDDVGGSVPQCDGPKAVYDERIPSRGGKPESLPQWLGDLGELDSLSTASNKRREMCHRSGGREGTNDGLVSQSTDPDQWRFPVIYH